MWLWFACTPEPPRSLSHEGYVWQRDWTAEVREGVEDVQPLLSALRVLALEGDAHGLVQIPVALEGLDGEIVAVVRWDGRIELPDAGALARQMLAVVDRWRAAGVQIRGVELDCDQPTSGLETYVQLVEQLRTLLPEDLQLSITALPTWASSPHLPALLAAPDEVVLQVHAVDEPSRGLFDPQRARIAIERYAREGEPLAVSLPAYGSRVGDRELVPEPGQVAQLLRALESGPREVRRVLWFRVPVRSDQRHWRLPTLRAVIRGESLEPSLQVLSPGLHGLWDLKVYNAGEIDAVHLPSLEVRGDCPFADALQGWTLQEAPGGWTLRGEPGWLREGETRPAGWVRCNAPPEVQISRTTPRGSPP